ncbi:hypothetical protein CEUSTIGMA_g10771.t1 [Chlamydomonas eustigma]|uniref:Elongator complex protein 5 n=1 Tax=Chlamydomonas eustigma TaxID=1157962 RepID=A0A250XK02_9CHLO|nr:hypothetical protein CEUSTIGMA_g10771.t1 [Chlamydomonas eustigma]|eukprot:GAX83346.1 hypothetical protein CEUSTIGMA_g10771.t1 [Chlamydomonas eustigma]
MSKMHPEEYNVSNGMDSLNKHLRDGNARAENGCALAVFFDSLDTVGGRNVFERCSAQFVESVIAGRSQASHVYYLALEESPAMLPAQKKAVTVLNLCASFSHEWTSGSEQTPIQDIASSLLEGSLCSDPSCASQSMASGQLHAVIIDSISELLIRYSYPEVLTFLTTLQQHPQITSILTIVHKDLHEDQILFSLEALSTCIVRLQSLSRLHREVATRHASGGAGPHGYISFRYKRRAGRLRTETLLYTIMSNGSVKTEVPPASLSRSITAEALVALSVSDRTREPGLQQAVYNASSSSSPYHLNASTSGLDASSLISGRREGGGTPALQAGGMKVGQLTAQEQMARDQVRLPYEHQGQGAKFQTADFRDYLPGPAGGRAGQQHHIDADAYLEQQAAAVGRGEMMTRHDDVAVIGYSAGASLEGSVTKLGHIVYVRDSEEEHDSDEDPDDDLDI